MLSDPHLEELTIKADIGNTKLIISNIYIPPSRLHRTPLSLVISTRTIRHGTQERSRQEEKEWTSQSMELTMVYSTGIAPREFHQTQSRV